MKGIDILNADEGTQFPLAAELFRRAYRFLEAHDHGDLMTYAAFTEAMELNPALDHRARSAVLRAGRVLLKEHRKRLVNVRTVGYRIVQPNEHVAVSDGERRSARRSLRRAMDTVVFVHLEKLSPQEVARVMFEQTRVSLQNALMHRLERPKTLPPKRDIAIPSSRELIRLLTRKPDETKAG